MALSAAASSGASSATDETTFIGTVSQISDGQAQATSSLEPVSQITDGQAQATSEIASASDQNFESDAGAASSVASITKTPLPLTTIYTAPASCSQIVTWDGENLWQYGTNQTGGDCYPPDFLRIFNSFYTPGICPDAWTSAGKIAHSSGHDAMCCPKSVDRFPSVPLYRQLISAQWLLPFQTQRLRVCQYLFKRA